MAEENKKSNEGQEELSDIEIAELANKKLKEKDAEIAQLKKDLAKEKLLSNAPEDDDELMSKEECIKVITDSRTSNYDYAVAVLDLVDNELSDGKPNPLGKNGEDVYNFLKDTVEECDGDKSRFTSIYQAKLGADDPSVAMAFRKRNRN